MLSGAGRSWKLVYLIQKLLSRIPIPSGAKVKLLPLTPDDRAFVSYVTKHFDPDWYLKAYPDIAAARVDPLSHWLNTGLMEGRLPGPNMIVRHGPDAHRNSGSAWKHFTWRREPIAICQSSLTEDQAFAAAVSASFEPDWYLKAYPDIAAARVDPLSHWLNTGLMEGRLPGPNMIVRHGPDAHRNSGSAWKHFTWRREPIALKISHVPDTIVTQIRAQARHDPGILAAGSLAIPLLPHLEATDLFSRDGIDSHSIFTAVPEHPEVIFMIPRLVVGGAEKYTADMIGALVGFGLTRILILVTEQTAKAAGDQRAHAIFAPAQATHILFWPDICGPSHESPAVLARLLNVLRPKATVVVNSRVGLDMTAKFGRGLSQFSRLYCAYFSLGVQGLGAPYGTRFPRQTAPFAVSLTDNEPTAAILRDRYRDIEGPGVAVLPPCLPSTDDQTFTERLVRREKRTVEGARRWAWVSRIEEFKGTAILAALAELRPNDKFELFGPLEHDLDRLGLDLANVVYRGVLEEVSKADFSSHDGFLFTSLFEGMPNVVLEMSQHAIPMILADVGGLRDTFDDTAVMFVEHSADIRETAATFSVALDRTATLSAAELVTMLTYARNQALARHAADMHARGVLNLLGVQ